MGRRVRGRSIRRGRSAQAAAEALRLPLVPRRSAESFLVAGVGASAGGLEAFTQFLKALPVDTGVAFVLVQHLDPKHESLLTELLSRATSLSVTSVTEGVVVAPNCVYVIPPNVEMEIRRDTLHLLPRSKRRGMHMPIDGFFRSLAEDRQGRAIGIILSGTASDGAMGMGAIKAAGGITFAQDDQSAKYGGMPQSAIAAGVVDFVLPPEGIAHEIAQIGSHPFIRPGRGKTVEIPADSDGTLAQIFRHLLGAAGVDFSLYKQNTIRRRIKRRMVLHRMERLEDYVAYLRRHPDESKALYEDLLINVTGFFRDPEMFDSLKSVVFPAIGREVRGPIRIWVPGCSTGEEAYSIVISLLEFLGDRVQGAPIQMFATDLSEPAIETARVGIYPESITGDVSNERIRRFFVKVERGFQVSKMVRDVCVFARHDVTKDPPFSRLDIISCRNVLIYLGPILQKQVVPVFHYALNPGRFLVLATAEGIGGSSDLFQLVDRKSKIYSKKGAPTRFHLELPSPGATRVDEAKALVGDLPREADVQRETDRVLLARFAPAGVLITEAMEIIQVRGHTGAYLEPAPGQAGVNLLRMAREGLAPVLRTAVHKALKTQRPVHKNRVPYLYDGERRAVDIEVIPISLRARSTMEPHFLVMFDHGSALRRGAPRTKGQPFTAWTEKRETGRLRRELVAAKEYLQSIIEEQEASNEELKSANEEILSSNEELQSTNEELETAKEELQSSNEELTTLNEELQNRNSDLGQLNNDLSNVLASVNLPIVILGADLRIRRFTPAAEKALNLIASDVGRRITDIRPNIALPDLEPMLLEVIDTVRIREMSIQDTDGRWHSLRLRPYRTLDNRIDGVVMMLVDIDEVKRSSQLVRESQDYAEAIVATVTEAIVVLSADLRVRSANRSFYELFQLTPEETLDRPIQELGDGRCNIPRLISALRAVAGEKEAIDSMDLEADFPIIGHRGLLMTVRRVQGSTQGALLCAISDITERLQAEKAVGELSGHLLQSRDEEQRRIARELHDATAQNLAAITMHLKLIDGSKLSGDARRHLTDCSDLAQQCSRELRDIASLLHPPLLDEIGLIDAVNWYIESFSRRSGIKVTLKDADEIGRLPKDVETALFRIVQESLANVQRHSGSPAAEIEIEHENGEVSAQIVDHGKGMPKGLRTSTLMTSTTGMGIAAMRERAKQLGGVLTVHSGDDGTTIKVRLPVTKGNA